MLEHVNMVAVKAQKSVAALCMLMQNKGGPCSSIRKVLGQWCVLFYFMQILFGERLWSTKRAGKSWNRHKEEWHNEFAVHNGLSSQRRLLLSLERCPSRSK